MSVGVLQGDQRFFGSRDRLIEARCVDATAQRSHFIHGDFIH
jgi:hypothetical protein